MPPSTLARAEQGLLRPPHPPASPDSGGSLRGARQAPARRRRLSSASSRRHSAQREGVAGHGPFDVLLDDLKFLQHHTGLDLLTPLGEVRDVHDQVVAVLNPLAGRSIQQELEDEVAALQAELAVAQQEVSASETRLTDTLSDLSRLEAFASSLHLGPVSSTPSAHAPSSPAPTATAAPAAPAAHAAAAKGPSSAPVPEAAAAAVPQSQREAASTASRSQESPPGAAPQEAPAEGPASLPEEGFGVGSRPGGVAGGASAGPQSMAPALLRQREEQVLGGPWETGAAAAGAAAAAEAERTGPVEKSPKPRNPMLDVRLDTPEPLREFWYPAEFSGKLAAGRLVPLELFGEQWVLFRDGEGRAACLVDECAHRACPLSLGSVENGAVQCPYHGWRYDGAGACTAMPSTAFRPGVAVRALPTREADGFVWVWPGEGPPVGDVPRFTQPPQGFQVHTELLLDVPVEHGLLLENLLDLAHAPFTHTSTFAKGWPIPDAVRFHTRRLLGGNWEPYPIDMSFEPPCGVLSTIGLAQPGRIERGLTAQQCSNHLHQLHVCIPAGPTRTRLLYRMSMDFLGWTRAVPGIQRFWAHIAQQVMGEDLVLVAGQQDRVARGGNAWANPVAYDKLGIRYRRWRNALARGNAREAASARGALAQKFSAGELFSLECSVSDDGLLADSAITNMSCGS